MIKFALLITGTVRNYKHNYSTWYKYFIELFNVDIFFHTYDIYGYKLSPIGNPEPDMSRKININEIITLIRPKKYKIDNLEEKLIEFKKDIPTQFINKGLAYPEYIKSQLYSIYSANKLKHEYEKENNFKYDIVMKIRFDTMFNSYLNLNDIEHILSNSDIILCGHPNIGGMVYKNACINCMNTYTYLNAVSCTNHTIVSDLICITNSDNMNYYSELYLKYDNMIKQEYDKYLQIPLMSLGEYICAKYGNDCLLYKNVPHVKIVFPEKILSMYLTKYILLNYSIEVCTNRKIIY